MVLLFFDPTQRISKVDKQLCDYVAENYKPCVFVVNKWDLMADSMLTEKWVGYLYDTFRTMWYVPIAFITGQTGKNVKALLNHAQMLFKQSRQRVTTADLNRVVRDGVGAQSAAAASEPPAEDLLRHAGRHWSRRRSCCFAASRRRLPETYRRYLLSAFRESLPFGEVPIKLYLRKRVRGDQRDDIEAPGRQARAGRSVGAGFVGQTAVASALVRPGAMPRTTDWTIRPVDRAADAVPIQGLDTSYTTELLYTGQHDPAGTVSLQLVCCAPKQRRFPIDLDSPTWDQGL